jgi:thioredoxin reductase (NADPH)
MHTKVAIIGSGPAGLTAGLYTGRALLAPILFSGQAAGGQLMTTTEVENFPGFPDGIQGPDLILRMQQQAEKFGTKIINQQVKSVDIIEQPFRIKTESATYMADTIILATGADARWLGLESETRLRGHGVSCCATCDGFFFRGKEIAVIGGGDSAMEEALFLTRFATKVSIIHRRAEFRASKIMQEKVKSHPKITFILETEVKEILGENTVTGIRVHHKPTVQESTLSVAGVFVAIGHTPNSAFISGQIETDGKGYILTNENYESSVSGVFVAGDVHDHKYRQAITAAGAGCAAAMEAERHLSKYNSH